MFSEPTLLGLDFYLSSESGEKNLALAMIGNPVLVFADDVPNNAPTPVPEPATMLLVGIGLLTVTGFGRKKLFR
jgi:hypothetical protein